MKKSYSTGSKPKASIVSTSAALSSVTVSMDILPAEPEFFVPGWTVRDTLGEGAFGSVSLLVNISTGDKIAMKTINLKLPKASDTFQKETKIMEVLSKNPNESIIAYFGKKQTSDFNYIFMEYAQYGELFDKIDELGMPLPRAQRYMRMILNAVEFMHARGICHRDIKPENMLICENDVLKICDFGLATVFRARGEERLIGDVNKVGTIQYVAPEVMAKGRYAAQPADLWSCAIVFVAMLTGAAPFEMPVPKRDKNFAAWVKNPAALFNDVPWSRLGGTAMSLVSKILVSDATQRLTLAQIKAHEFFQRDFTAQASTGRFVYEEKDAADASRIQSYEFASPPSVPPTPRTRRRRFHSELLRKDADEMVCLSQPPTRVLPPIEIDCRALPFSQPTCGEALLCSQANFESANPQDMLVKRMTRFFVMLSARDALEAVTRVCEVQMHYVCRKTGASELTIFTTDRRHSNLSFKAAVYNMSSRVLVDFRLSKGDGLEFKRIFAKIKKELMQFIENDASELSPFAAGSKLKEARSEGEVAQAVAALVRARPFDGERKRSSRRLSVLDEGKEEEGLEAEFGVQRTRRRLA